MEGDGVGLVVKFFEQASLHGGGIGEKLEGLIAMAGEDDFIEEFGGSVGGMDLDLVTDAGDAGGLAFELEAVLKWGGDFFDVAFRAIGDGEPRVLGMEAKEAVIVPETEERDGGEVEHF